MSTTPYEVHGDWWWLTGGGVTVAVKVVDGLVADGPPITGRFRGRFVGELTAWLAELGSFAAARLEP